LAAWLITLFVIVSVVAPILVVTSAAKKSFKHAFSGLGGGYTLTTPAVPAPGGDGFFVIAPTRGSGTNVLRRVDPINHRVLWSSTNLNNTSGESADIVAGTNQVFAIFGTTVLALDPNTGRQLWQASLSNGLATPCDSGCAVLVGSRLVALSKDGVVQAFDAATGAQTWSKRLNSTPRWLEAAGSSVLVDDISGAGPALVVLDIDAQTGTARTIAPSCAPSADPIGPARPTEESELFVSPDGAALTVLIADSSGCVVQYGVSNGSQMWQTPPDQNTARIPFSLTGQSALVDAQNLVWTNDENGGMQVFALNRATGAIRQLVDDKRNNLQLVGIVGTTLVIKATPRFDPQKPATVGVDLATGVQRWQAASRVTVSGDNQGALVTSRSPIIVSCNSNANTCKFEAIDSQTGTVVGSSTVTADPAEQQEVHLVNTPDTLLVTAGWNHVVGVDPATAAIRWSWPS
jgi:outer membrane protein assembly factor BamB